MYMFGHKKPESTYLYGYVVIQSASRNPIKVLGKRWATHYKDALRLAAEEKGIVSSRNWVFNTEGKDPVKAHKLHDISLVVKPKHA